MIKIIKKCRDFFSNLDLDLYRSASVNHFNILTIDV